MAFQADFKYGTPKMVDYTPSGAVVGGQVVVIADSALIAHRDIAAGKPGALAAGGGVYMVVGDAAILEDKKVYWVDATNKVTETAGSNRVLGYTVPGYGCAADGGYCLVRHEPEKT